MIVIDPLAYIIAAAVSTVVCWLLALWFQSRPGERAAVLVMLPPPQKPRERVRVITPAGVGDSDRDLLVKHAKQVRALGLDKPGWHPEAPPLISSLPDRWVPADLDGGWDVAPIEVDNDPPAPPLPHHPDEDIDLAPLDPPAPRRRW